MKLTFIGCGSAFSKKNFHSNMVLEATEVELGVLIGEVEIPPKYYKRRMLIDCGRTAPEAMAALGLGWHDIDALYVSHQHNDHIGAIEEFAFMRFFVPNGKDKPSLYCDERLMEDLWDHSLKGGMASIENHVCTLGTFFDLRPVRRNEGFTFAGTFFRLVQAVHVMNGYSILPSYGLKFTTPGGTRVFITTDTQHCPTQIGKFYADADVIFQDCETSKFKSGVHAHYDDLRTLAPEVKRKMWLYHYQDGELPDAVAHGFAGFVTRGQTFDLDAPFGVPQNKAE